MPKEKIGFQKLSGGFQGRYNLRNKKNMEFIIKKLKKIHTVEKWSGFQLTELENIYQT